MDEQRIKRFAVPALIGLVLVGLIGSIFYQSGWSQGYMLGLLTSGRDSGALVAPYVMHGGHFGFFGGIFRFFFALLFIGFIFKALRCVFWRMGGHHDGWGDGGRQNAHWHRHHGPWAPNAGDAKGSSPQAGSGPARGQEPTMRSAPATSTPDAASSQPESIMYV